MMAALHRQRLSKTPWRPLAVIVLFVVLWWSIPVVNAQSCGTAACIVINQPLAEVNATEGALLNATFSALLPGSDVDVSVLDYQGLASADIDLELFTELLQTEVGAGTPREALDTEITLLQFLDVAAAAAQADGNVAAVNALGAISLPLLGTENDEALGTILTAATFPVSSFLNTNNPSGDFAEAEVDLLSLVTAGVQTFNYQNAVSSGPVGINNDSGLLDALGLGGIADSATIEIVVVEPPSIGCGPAGTEFSSAGVRVKLTVDLVDVSVGESPAIDLALAATSALLPGTAVTADGDIGQVELYLDIGRSQGRVVGLDATQQTAIVEVETGTVDLYLGEIDDAAFFSRRVALDPDRDLLPGTIGNIVVGLEAPLLGTSTLDLNITARSHTRSESSPERLFFSGPFPETQTTMAGSADIPLLVGNLLDNLEVDLQLEASGEGGLDPVFGGLENVTDILLDTLLPAVDTVVGDVLLDTLSPVLSGLLDNGLLDALGVGIGSADVTALGIGVSCPVYGHVYVDSNTNGARENGEDGPPLTLFAKLFPTNPLYAGLSQAVPVDPTSGAYEFDIVPAGDYRIVIDDNDDLNDNQPNLPAGWLRTEAPTGERTVRVAMGGSGQNFGLFNGSRVEAEVFLDTGGPNAAANDGIRSPGEAGLGDVTFEVSTDSGTIMTRRSNANGQVVFWLPASVSGPISLCETNPPSHFSTGATAPVGSYDVATDCISLEVQPGNRYNGLQFGDVPSSRFGASTRGTTTAGSTVQYRHRFIAGTDGSVSLTAESTRPDWAQRLYRDSDCNGELDLAAQDELLTTAVTIQASEEICLISEQDVPTEAQSGNRQVTELVADFTPTASTPDRNELLSLTELTFVVAGDGDGISLSKSADRDQVLPGDFVTYTLAYSNQTGTPISEVTVRDSLPAYTEFVSAECIQPYPAGIEDCSVESGIGNAGDGVRWSLTGALAPGAIGEVQFTVRLEE